MKKPIDNQPNGPLLQSPTNALDQRLNRAATWIMHHWLLFANSFLLLYAGLPWLSPLLRWLGWERLGQALFVLYRPFCHQKPERSFVFCGHQVAICHRCVALYTSVLVGGVLFGLLRRWIRPASWRLFWVMTLPILIDGLLHMADDIMQVGFRGGGDAIGTPNFWLRMITGVVFGIAVVITIHPRLDHDLQSVSFGSSA